MGHDLLWGPCEITEALPLPNTLSRGGQGPHLQGREAGRPQAVSPLQQSPWGLDECIFPTNLCLGSSPGSHLVQTLCFVGDKSGAERG